MDSRQRKLPLKLSCWTFFSQPLCAGLLLYSTAAFAQPATITQIVSLYGNVSGPIAPGEPILIFGSNLATGTGSCGAFGNLPATCHGAALYIGGFAAPVSYATSFELQAIVPFELYTASATVSVTVGGQQGPPFSVNVVPALPMFASNTFVDPYYQVYNASRPANPGDPVSAFMGGLGVTNPPFADGEPPPSDQDYEALAQLQITVGGVPATTIPPIAESGSTLSYLVQFQVPAGLSGSQPVVVTADGMASAAMMLAISGSSSALSISTGPSLGTFPLGEIQLPLVASGGNGGYTWTVASGILPPGLAIRGDVPVWLSPYAPQGLIGIATTAGAYNFTLNVSSGGSSTSQSFSMKISQLSLTDGPTLPDAFVGSAYYSSGYQLTATRNGNPAYVTCTPTNAGGLSLSAACLIAGTPTATGTVTIPVTYTDGTDTFQQNLSIQVYGVQIANAGLLPNAVRNSAYSATLTPAGGTPPYSYSLAGSPLPTGLSLNGATISGVVLAPPAKYNFTVAISDSQNHSYTARIAIDVLGNPAVLPQISVFGDLADCTVGLGCSRAISISGGTAPYSWAPSGYPLGMSFRYGSGSTLAYVNPNDLEIYGTPTRPGLYNILISAIDSNNISVTQVFPLRVSALLLDSCVSATSCPGLPDGSTVAGYAATLRVLGGTPPYLAAPQASANAAGRLPYALWMSPTAVTGDAGEDGWFTPLLSITDSSSTPNQLTTATSIHVAGSSSSAFTVEPVFTQYITQGRSYSLQLAACCAAGYTWTQVGGLLPTGITLNAAGVLSGTTNAPAGSYNFAAQAADSSNGGTRSWRLVTLVPTPMIVTSNAGLPAAIAGKPYPQNLTVSGASGTVQWTLAPFSLLPPGLTLNSNGSFGGAATWTGAYEFGAIATDQQGNVTTGTFTIPVYSGCDLDANGKTTTSDVQTILSEALGKTTATHDLTGDKVVNVADVQNVLLGVVLHSSCAALFQ